MRLWRVSDGHASCVTTLKASSDAPKAATMYSLAVEPIAGQVLCAGGSDGVVQMWDLRSHTLLHVLSGHSASTVRALCFLSDGTLCSAGGDSKFLKWQVPLFAADDEQPLAVD